MTHMTKKELKQDTVLSYLHIAANYFLRYKEKFIIVFIGILAIIAAGISLNYQKKELEKNAFAELTKAKQELKAGQIKQAEKNLEELVFKYLNTQAGIEATIFICNHYYKKGNYDKCLDLSNTAIKKIKAKDRLYPNLLIFQGYSHEQKKEYDFAIKRLKEITQKYPNHYITPDAYASLARCYILAEKKEEAIATYKLITQKYPDSLWAKNALDSLKKLNR